MEQSLWKRISFVNIFYLTATPIGALILVPLYLYRNGFDWRIWLTFSVMWFFTSFSITGGYHRLFAHKSYRTNSVVKWFFLLIGASAFQGSVLKWATDHRRHHQFVDTPDDPYNIHQGFFYAHLGWLILDDNPKYKGRFAKDLMQDPAIAFQHRYYLWFALLTGFAVPIYVGHLFGSALGGLAVLACLRLVTTNHATFFINSLCHTLGNQPYTDQNSARDSFVMAILAVGEGYHNFHHRFQFDYRNGVRWYHWDPTKWVVSFLEWCRFAHDLKRTPAPQILKARLEMDEQRLVNSGVPLERLHPFRQKIDEAQKKLKQLREDYIVMKQNMQCESSKRLRQLKMEMRESRRELKMALHDWMIVRKRPRLVTV